MTTSEDVLLREVDEEVAQDRQLAAFRKYGPYIAGLAVLLLAIVALLQVRAARAATAQEEASTAYEFALGEDATAGALFDFAGTVPADGYRALALMRGAGTAAREGDRTTAIGAYARVYDDETLPTPLRDLARVRAGYLALDDGGTAADTVVTGVTSEAFQPYAREVMGLSALARGDYASAVATFEAGAGKTGPAASRASNFLALARSGAAGVPLEAPQSDDDFLSDFGQALREGTLDLPGAETADEGAVPEAVEVPEATDAPETSE